MDQTGFNPRSREGSDRLRYASFQAWGTFQSTLPRGERLVGLLIRWPMWAFQSTLPRGERPRPGSHQFAPKRFQSTLPRGERPGSIDGSCSNLSVSIHAPARGATTASLQFRGRRPVSIHAPARGATTIMSYPQIRLMVSIHAPARGATMSQHTDLLSAASFNPRSREGSDKTTFVMINRLCKFQSTLPRGERLTGIIVR